MTEKINENTEENPTEEEKTVEENPEEETPEEPQNELEEAQEETPQEETETPEEKTDSPEEKYTDREKRYYARMKQAEKDAKEAKEALKKATESDKPVSEVDTILEVQSATKGLEPEEVVELRFRASTLGISLSEARKNEDFILWQKAWREKVAKERTPPPSTKQPETEKPKTLTERLAAADKLPQAESLAAKEKILREVGAYKPPKPPPGERVDISTGERKT